ncbi:hypothetical protein ABK040_004700 [Willaertia magna]
MSSWARKKQQQKRILEEEDPLFLLSGGIVKSNNENNNSLNSFNNNESSSETNKQSDDFDAYDVNVVGVKSKVDEMDWLSLGDEPTTKTKPSKTNNSTPTTTTSSNNLINSNSKQPSTPTTTTIIEQQPITQQKNLPPKPLPNVVTKPLPTVTPKPLLPTTPTSSSSSNNNNFNNNLEEELKKSKELIKSLQLQVSQLEIEKFNLQKKLDNIPLEDLVQNGHKDFDDYFDIPMTLIDKIADGLTCTQYDKMILTKGKDNNNNSFDELYDDFDENVFKYKNLMGKDYNLLLEEEIQAYCNLRKLRTYSEKYRMLTKFGTFVNYDIIIPVILFLEQTLTFRSFMQLLLDADSVNYFYLNIYCKYLKRLGDLKTLQRVYKYCGMVREELMALYTMALKIVNPFEKLDALEHLLSFVQKNAQAIDNSPTNNTNFNNLKYSLNCSAELTKHISNYIHLISRQLKIDEFDKVIATKEAVFQSYPRNNIYNTTVADTLRYCCFYHPFASEEKLSSPKGLAKLFQLSLHRYLYEMIVSRSKIGDWKGVISAFQKATKEGLTNCSAFELKENYGDATGQSSSGGGISGAIAKFFKGKPNRAESNSVLNIYNVCNVMKMFRAPKSILQEVFLSYSFQKDEIQLKYDLSKEFKIYKISISIIVNDFKDRDLLLQLKDEIVKKYHGTDKTEIIDELNSYLYNKKLKWKKATINIEQ